MWKNMEHSMDIIDSEGYRCYYFGTESKSKLVLTTEWVKAFISDKKNVSLVSIGNNSYQ